MSICNTHWKRFLAISGHR